MISTPAAQQEYPSVLSAISLGGIRVPNRVVFPAFQMNYAHTDGTISEKLIDFYSQLADGGCGLIIVGAAVVSSDSVAFDRVIRIDGEDHVPGLARLFSAIKTRGAVPGIQLIHYGRQALGSVTCAPLLAPSAVPCPVMSRFDKDYRVVEMNSDHILRVKNDFIQAGLRAARAGAQLIEIHAAHGYLLNEFLSPYSNRRSDDYGGDTEGRTRLIREIVEGIRRHLDGACAISVRVSGNEHVAGGLVPGDYRDIVPALEQAGMDLLNVSAGVYESMERIVPPSKLGDAPHLGIATELKAYGNRPVCLVGSISSLAKAEEIVAGGGADLVALGRAQIADPQIVKKSKEGRLKDITKCSRCNLCTFWSTGDAQMFCSVNPFFKRTLTKEEAHPHSRLFETITATDVLSPPRKYIREILRALCQNLGYHFGSVIRVEGENKGTMVSAYELPDDYLEQAAKAGPLYSSPIREALSTRRIVTLRNPLADARMAPWRDLLGPRGVQTMVWVPLLSGTRAFGAYILYSRDEREIRENEMDTLEQMARLISIAITSNQYLDALMKKTQELKRAYEELRAAEARLVQSEKMSAVGQLAAGVAHEINNPLGIILGFAQGISQRVKPGDPFEMPIRSIEREALRCKNLVLDLLTFSRSHTGKNDRLPIDLNNTIEAATRLVEASAKMNSVEIQLELTADLPPIAANANQIQQVVINLSNNAIDAMPKGGILRIATETLQTPPMSWACLKVSDTGEGIPAEAQSRIFEPFFTTKPVGKGTGLGLSLVFEIVKKHSGTIDIHSRPGSTEFSVRLPIRTG